MQKLLNKNNIPLLIILLIGFILRIIHLDYLTLWTDEHMHVSGANHFIKYGNFDNLIDKNGILLTFTIIPLFSIFGESDFLARLPSVFFGVGSILIAYKLVKQILNKNTALITALLISISPYFIFWSKVARNYSIFSFFSLLSLYFFIQVFIIYKPNKKNIEFLKKLEINYQPLIAFILSFLGGLLSHQLAFFLIFGYGFYFIIIGTKELIIRLKNKTSLLNKNILFLIPSLLLYSIIFIPFVMNVFKPVLGILLQEQTINWFLPDWNKISESWNLNPFKSFNTYTNVLVTDYKYFYLFGFIGFIITLIKKTNIGVLILSMFLPFLLLMSFIFREPNLPRYLIDAYFFFILSIAIALDFIYSFIITKVLKRKPNLYSSLLLICILSFIGNIYSTTLNNFNPHHGNPIDKKLSSWFFPNWKEPLNNIKKHLKEDDIILTTHPSNTKHYLKGENIFWFRQRKLDGATRKYVPYYTNINPNKIPKNNAHSLKGIKQLIKENNRGWLIADYYFHNIMTDPLARDFIYKNTNYRKELSITDVEVYSWDKSKPKQQNSFVEILGQSKKIQSKLLNFQLKESNKKHLTFTVELEGLDYNNELALILNKKTSFYIKKEHAINKKTAINNRQTFRLNIPIKYFNKKNNNVLFQYNNKVKRERFKGVIIYNLK